MKPAAADARYSLAVVTGSRAQADADLQPGTVVGEYEIQEEIGRGGFGSVYRAVHPVLGKKVAVKVLMRRWSEDPQIVSRFVSEAKAATQIGHANIVDVFGFGQLPDRRYYFVMEHLQGVSLARLLEQREVLDAEETAAILEPVAAALDAAHQKGIIHRDLKAENVFLEVDHQGKRTPRLLDFGLAKLLGEDPTRKHKTQAGARVGTPLYMSPEQCRGRRIDAATDIYSLGVLAYRMLTGVFPYPGPSEGDIVLGHLSRAAERPSRVRKGLPGSVDGAVLRMLEKERKRRPRSAALAVEALRNSSSLLEDASPSSSSRGRLYLVLAAGALLLVGLAVGVTLTLAGTRTRTVTVPGPVTVAKPVTPDAAPSVPAQVNEVAITFEGETAGAEVLGPNDEILLTLPGTLELPRSYQEVQLKVRAPGYTTKYLRVVPMAPSRVQVELKKKSATERSADDPNAIMNPF